MIVGIDLGTTNSLIAYFDKGGAKIIPNRYGENLTPSVVSMDENNILYVGKAAKERKIRYTDDTVEVFKRSMGTNKEYFLQGKPFKPEELSSFILKSLKEDAEKHLGTQVTEAVISVPAYFNDQQRRATKKAGELAGFKVERIISEPTAAAIAYGIGQKEADTKFIVFDLGGGTFDVSILELYHNIMEVRAVAGDNFLGGEDFTEVLYNMFIKEKKIDVNELTRKEVAYIKSQAELCKIGFSDGNKSVMKCNIKDETIEMTVDFEDYSKECRSLLEKLQKPIERSLNDAGIKVSEIDKVIMVGGGTRLQVVRKFVGRLFQQFPDYTLNPDEVVALGAAMQGAIKDRNDLIKEVILTDVCPYTLGTGVVKVIDGENILRDRFCPIIERNTVIPVSRQEILYTVNDYQTNINIDVLQGESRIASNNLKLGELNVKVPRAKAGKERIKVVYTYDINSILEVVVTVLSTNEEKRLIIQPEDCELTEEEINKRFEELSYLKILPKDEEENKLLIFRGERLYEESIGDIRYVIDNQITNFERALDTRDNKVIEKAREEYINFLEAVERKSNEMDDEWF